MADPHIQMGEVLKEARKNTEGPEWSYPVRAGHFADIGRALAPLDINLYGDRSAPNDAFKGFANRFPSLKTQAEINDETQGSLAPALRTVRGYLIYIAVFAAGWFASAVYSLGVLKGWW